MDEEQGLQSPIAGGIRGIRRSVSSSIFTGRAVPPPQPDPQTTSLLNQNSLTLTTVSGQLQNVSAQVGSLTSSLVQIQQNLALRDQLEAQRAAAQQKREQQIAEQGLREGKESNLEQKIQFALLAPVRKVQTFAQGILSRLTNFLLIIAGGWLVEQTLQFLRLKSEGNVDALNKLKVRIISDLLITGTIVTVITMAVLKAIAGLKLLAANAFKFVVGTFIKAPFRMLSNFIKNNIKNFVKLLRAQFGKMLKNAPGALLKFLRNPLSIVGALGIGGVGIKEQLKQTTKTGSKGLLSKIGGVGKANIIVNTIFGAFDFISRRKDQDGDGKPDQTIFQATSGVVSRIVGSGVGFAGGMKIGGLIGTFVGGPPGTLVGGILGGIFGLLGSMIVGGAASDLSDKVTGVEKKDADGSNVEGETKDEVDLTNAKVVDVGGPESITPINSKKELNVASNLELEEGTPTIVNIPLNNNQGMSSGGTGGASSEKGDAQTIPNIPSSDFANTSIAMAESVFNLGGVG